MVVDVDEEVLVEVLVEVTGAPAGAGAGAGEGLALPRRVIKSACCWACWAIILVWLSIFCCIMS